MLPRHDRARQTSDLSALRPAMYQKCINPACTGLCCRVLPSALLSSNTPAQLGFYSRRQHRTTPTNTAPACFGSRRSGVRISSPRLICEAPATSLIARGMCPRPRWWRRVPCRARRARWSCLPRTARVTHHCRSTGRERPETGDRNKPHTPYRGRNPPTAARSVGNIVRVATLRRTFSGLPTSDLVMHTLQRTSTASCG